MATEVSKTVEELKSENLELKLDAIRKGADVFKADMHRHLDLILEQTSKTNGSVARALEKIAEIERHDTSSKLAELKINFEEYKIKNKFWTLIATNRWIAALIVIVGYAFTIQEFRELIFGVFRVIK